MKQIIVWSGSALALASIFSTPFQAVGSGGFSMGASQGKKVSISLPGAPLGERRASAPPLQVQPQQMSDEEKLKILHQDAKAYVQTQGEKSLTDAAWVSWFIKRYNKNEAFTKIWLAKLKIYDPSLWATTQVSPPPAVATPGLFPPPLPPRNAPMPPAVSPLPPPLKDVPPLPDVTTLKPVAGRQLPPKSKEKTPVEMLSEQMDARRKAIDDKNKDVGDSQSSEGWD